MDTNEDPDALRLLKWGEEIDATNFLTRAWPRAAALAEQLWSPRAATGDAAAAAPRLHRFVCRLKARGLPAQPIAPSSCFKPE